MTRRSRRLLGVSLVELMVAVVIGMVLILAITQMMIRQDRIRRSVTGINDVAQSSAYASSTLDRDLRSAGSGLAQAWRGFFGCRLHAARDGVQILPRGSEFKKPFDSVPADEPGTIRGASFLIHGGAGPGDSDVLQVMSGTAGMAEVGFTAKPSSAKTDQLGVANALGVQAGDLALISETGRDCMVQQLKPGYIGGANTLLEFGGTYASGTIGTLSLAGFSTGNLTEVSLIGNTSNNPPRLLLVGHDERGVLYSLDILRIDGSDAPVVIGEGVLLLRALYGIDTNSDGRVDNWVSPTTDGWKAEQLTDGTPAQQAQLLNVMAVRVGMMLRGDLLERDAVSPSSLTLFADLEEKGLSVKRDLTAEERRLRVRTYEFTVPLRNTMIASRGW